MEECTEHTPNNIPEKAKRDFVVWEPIFQEKIKETNHDVASLKSLAFNIPPKLPPKLAWFWVAKVMDVLARFVMMGGIDMKDSFSASDARKILSCFLGMDQMDHSVEMVKETLNKDECLMENFKTLINEVMSHESITEKMRCKHRESWFHRLSPFHSPFCQPCIQEDRRIEKKKNIILMSILGNKLNVELAVKDSVEKCMEVSGAVEVGGVGVSGSSKRKMTNDYDVSGKKKKIS